MDEAGNLYGTTAGGGTSGFGTVFKLDTSGTEALLYSFTNSGTDGDAPFAGLVMDKKGNLYGTTSLGGDLSGCSGLGCGTMFKVDTSGNEIVLHGFTDVPDGAFPFAGLIMDKKGNLIRHNRKRRRLRQRNCV